MIGERTKLSMLNVHNNFLTRIAEQLNAVELDFKAIEIWLDSYQSAIAGQAAHFALIEGETRKDRVAVKRLVKEQDKRLS
jgi:hypothetical protein